MIKTRLCLFCLLLFFISTIFSTCFAQDITSGIKFGKDDRVLILAPHPDDEAIATAGVIQRALKAGSKVNVICFTNGDHNEFAFIAYEKRITFRRGEFIHMGEVRRKETIAGMSSLGLDKKNIVFLGYPDFGTTEILTKYWETTKPFRDLLTRISRVPYRNCLSSNAPYVGESILKDLKKVILYFRPTKIFVSHPLDINRDHRSLYLFLQVSLWDLGGQIKRPEIFPYLVHVVGWPKPRGYHPDLELEPPQGLKDDEISWEKFELTEEEIRAKYQAMPFYKSQLKYNQYLVTFVRKNELFGDYPVIKLEEAQTLETIRQDLHSPRLAYAQQDKKNLFARLVLKRKIDEDFGVTVFLLGYSKKTAFAKMPKIRITFGLGGVQVRNKKQILFSKGIDLKYEDNAFILKVPLYILGDPDYIFACARTHTHDLPFNETSWRILDME